MPSPFPFPSHPAAETRHSLLSGGDFTTPALLIIPTAVRRAMIEHLASCLPLEGVGLLSAGASDSGLRVRDFYPGRNSDASPRRYTMDPVDVRAALFEMQRRGTRLGAIVHSHPRTPPTLSATDLAEARYAGVLSVIVGFEPQCEVRAWSFEFGAEGTVVGFGEVQIVEF